MSEFDKLDPEVEALLGDYTPGEYLSTYSERNQLNHIPEVESRVSHTLAVKTEEDDSEKAEILKNGLQPRHLQIIALFLNGKGTTEIARVMNMSISRVSIILNSPKAQDIIQDAIASYKTELSALMPRVLDAIREGLNSTFDNKMKAVDRYIKLMRADRGDGEDESRIQQTFVNLTINTRERAMKELSQLRGRFEAPIEAEYEEVKDVTS